MKRSTAVIFFAACVLMGIVAVSQFNAPHGEHVYTSQKVIREYEAVLASEQSETAALKRQIEIEKALLEEYRNDLYSKEPSVIMANVAGEYERFQVMSASVPVHGPGVVITVDDGSRELFPWETVNDVIVHDADILLIINELKRCGAEAISVNGQRLIETTSVNCSGWTIRINGVTYARPFTIKAIGDGKRMVAGLLANEGYGTSLKNWGVKFEIELADDVEVEAYGALRSFVYAGEVGKSK